MNVTDLEVVEGFNEIISRDIESTIVLVVCKWNLSFVGISPVRAAITPRAIVGISVPGVSDSDEFSNGCS